MIRYVRMTDRTHDPGSFWNQEEEGGGRDDRGLGYLHPVNVIVKRCPINPG
jgi:hypothetical protein